jgi:hypothetical protein
LFTGEEEVMAAEKRLGSVKEMIPYQNIKVERKMMNCEIIMFTLE